MGCLASAPDPSSEVTFSNDTTVTPQNTVNTNQVTNSSTNSSQRININQYKIGRTLGSGASCRVVIGIDKQNEKNQVAIKIMSKDQAIMQHLYKSEIEILSRLCPASQSPETYNKNILKFEGCNEDENSYYIVTKLLEGGELFDRIVSKEEKYIITEKQAAWLIRDMLSAVKYCHDNNVIHRDLKPENFVFATKEVKSDIVLIDFGCAKKVQDDEIVDDVVGTAYYLAPELACAALENFYKSGKTSKAANEVPKPKSRTGRILKATDVWAMGVIAYVMMTGRAPFRGKDNQEIFESTCTKPLTFPEKDARYSTQLQLSDSFKDFVTKILVKDPTARPSLEDAIRHPWVQGAEATDVKFNQEVVTYLRQFNYQSKLKKEITRVLASKVEQPEQEILRHFKRLDADGDGYLVADELKLLLLDMGYAKHEALLEAEKMVKNADINKDDKVDFEEFKAVWHGQLLSTNQQYIRRVFCVFDENGDGNIDAAELQSMLFPSDDKKVDDGNQSQDKKGEGFEILESIHHMIEEVDKDGDHKISFEEFEKAMKDDIDSGRMNMETLLAGGKIN